MNWRVTLYSCVAISTLICCNKPQSFVDQRRLSQLADRSCRAVSIRRQRYALADKIRFTQDTLGNTSNDQTKKRLEKTLKTYLKQKDQLLSESLSLADTIRLQLDSLMPYNGKVAQKRFARALDSLMRRNGCI